MTTSETGQAQSAGSGDGGNGGTSSMAAMFDRLRDAAARHDGDCDLLPHLQIGIPNREQPNR